ncbi:MAG: GGDEF domain-containing protein [Gemmatimonadota bacterium]|jgi:diguanylate cyclase (GGDEF)-like protein
MDFEPVYRRSERRPVWYLGRPAVPRRAVLLSIVALIIPIGATLVVPDATEEYQVLVWLLLLVPAFLLAYFRGWRGIAAALALGMAAMAVVQALLAIWGYAPTHPALMIGVSVSYVLIALGIGFLSDQLHQARMQAEELALTDELTSLANRRYIALMLAREFAAAQRGRPLVIVSFDLDRFKDYNDRYGHNAGDDALRAFGHVLSTLTRTMNISGRWGGEEFLAVLASSDVAGALVFVDRVRARLRDTVLKQGSVSVCVGVAAFNPAMRSVEDILIAADVALYEAKAVGPDSVRVYQSPAAGVRTA